VVAIILHKLESQICS